MEAFAINKELPYKKYVDEIYEYKLKAMKNDPLIMAK